MGLSGIGFALRIGRSLTAATVNIPANNAKGALLAYLDALVLNLALTPLLRATDLVRDHQGLIGFAGNKPRLRDDVRAYFAERDEDTRDMAA